MYNGLFQEHPHILEKVGYKVDQYNAICQKKKKEEVDQYNKLVYTYFILQVIDLLKL